MKYNIIVIIPAVDYYKYLGIEISKTGANFSEFVSSRCDQAQQRMSMVKGLLLRIHNATLRDGIEMYKYLVRPFLKPARSAKIF